MGEKKGLLDGVHSTYQAEPGHPVLWNRRAQSIPVSPNRRNRYRGGGSRRGMEVRFHGSRAKQFGVFTATILFAGGVIANATKDQLADNFSKCPAGREWSDLGPLPVKASPECKVGLPLPLKSEIAWPHGQGETMSGIAEYQITGVTKITNPTDQKVYPAVVTEFLPDQAGLAAVFDKDYENMSLPDYALNMVRHVGGEACAAELGRVIAWGQAGVNGLTTDATERKTIREGENHYAIDGNGGTAVDNPDAANILVVVRDPNTTTTVAGEEPFLVISCRDR
jgi:hypothetical protein